MSVNYVLRRKYRLAANDRAPHAALHEAAVEGRVATFREHLLGIEFQRRVEIEQHHVGRGALGEAALASSSTAVAIDLEDCVARAPAAISVYARAFDDWWAAMVAAGARMRSFSKLSAIHHLNDGGVRLFGVNGHVNKPGVFECAVGAEFETVGIFVNEMERNGIFGL